MFDRSTPIRQIMTRDPLTVRPDTIMTEVASLFRQHRMHHLPVVAEGKVLGMISTGEVHKLEHHFTLFQSAQSEQVNASVFGSLLAREVMQEQVVTIKEDASVQHAADIFRKNTFRALPVTDQEDHLVGIITPYDLMAFAYPGSTDHQE